VSQPIRLSALPQDTENFDIDDIDSFFALDDTEQLNSCSTSVTADFMEASNLGVATGYTKASLSSVGGKMRRLAAFIART
jgi:hypothetical protein